MMHDGFGDAGGWMWVSAAVVTLGIAALIGVALWMANNARHRSSAHPVTDPASRDRTVIGGGPDEAAASGVVRPPRIGLPGV